MKFTIYDAAGRIVRTGFCPDGMEQVQAQTGESMLPVDADLQLDYVQNGAVRARPTNPATLNANTITGIPTGAILTISGVAYTVDDGVAELDFTLPGTYSILINAFPYLDANFTVTK
ncbi:MAG TPA: hypothetical protein VNW52_03390 [Burkholderiaceae bacterium]|jgi:hypothetical protein|nr:hypothetical protein [Burkholderiaceae bacterium]